MKKITLMIMLLLCSITYSQEKYTVGIGVDPSLLINGAYDYDKTPVLDLSLSFSVIKEQSETGMFVEYAWLKDYYHSYGVYHNIIITQYNSVDFLIGGRVQLINRGYHSNKQQLFLTGGLDSTVRLNLTNNFILDFRLNNTWRRDLPNKKFGFSGYVEFKYVFNKI